MSSNQLKRVAIETELGIIELELEIERAPLTSANFLRYVEKKFYDNTSFYRTVTLDNQPNDLVKIEVIQGGGGMSQLMSEARPAPVTLERTNLTGLHHKDGTVSMARLIPDGATSEFFICISDQPELDYGGKRNPDGQGFAAFGQVTKGQEIVRQIQLAPAQAQNLTPPVKIIRIRALED